MSEPRYYTPWQVAFACFLGSPLAASWLMSRTYRAAGELPRAKMSIVWGLVGTAALLGLAFVLPDRIPGSAISGAVTIGMYHTARHAQAALIARCQADGVTQGSWWTAAGLGFLSLLLVVAVVAAVVFSLPGE